MITYQQFLAELANLEQVAVEKGPVAIQFLQEQTALLKKYMAALGLATPTAAIAPRTAELVALENRVLASHKLFDGTLLKGIEQVLANPALQPIEQEALAALLGLLTGNPAAARNRTQVILADVESRYREALANLEERQATQLADLRSSLEQEHAKEIAALKAQAPAKSDA